jgi:protocatechuate 3,4-dioxygenase beta subunit
MDNDDRQIGRVLSRREALKLLAAASAAMLAGCSTEQAGSTPATSTAVQGQAGSDPEAATVVATLEAAGLNEEAATSVATAEAQATGAATSEATAVTTAEAAAGAATTLPACIVSPELTEGPYFVDEQLNRSDIRTNSADGSVSEGVPLELVVRVSQIGNDGCTPLGGAIVDIWHCDALGVYSGVTDRSQGQNTTSDDFLRGYQVTDENGVARFTSIYPGWYRGRAVHIHFKVRTDPAAGQSREFTSQLFFDDAVSAQVYTQEPYAGKGMADTSNARDGIYRNNGDQLLLALTPAGQGYTTTFDVGLQRA